MAWVCLWAAAGAAETDPKVLYRRPMNTKNWRRGIIEECEPGNTFNAEFVEEGEAYTLEGYIPKADGKRVADDAGVFISIGIDLGNKDLAALTKILQPPKPIDVGLVQKLTPYLGLKGDAAEKKLAEVPFSLTPEEEGRLSDATKAAIFEEIKAAYNENKEPDSPEFSKLPLAYRTLAMSLFSQQSSYMGDGQGKRKVVAARNAIVRAFLKSDFANLEADIRQLGLEAWYPAARKKEADLFASLTTKCEQKMQVYFAVDESGSIGAENFELAKTLVTEFIDAMPDNQSLFGALFYNDSPKISVEYDRLVSKQEAKDKIKAHLYRMGGTRTDKAIEAAITIVEPMREVLNPQIYVVTDGRSEKPVTEAARKAREKMLVLNAVGVGQDINQAELREIAFDDGHWLVLKDYRQMKCNVRQFVTNICFQPDVRKNGDQITVEFERKSNAVFGIRVPKNSNLKVTIQGADRNACVMYGGINVEVPDELVSHYFHSGNSEVKEMVFKWQPEPAEGLDLPDGLMAVNPLGEKVHEFVARILERLQALLHKPDDRLVLGRRNATPDVNKDDYYAFVNIYSKNAKKLTLTFQECKDGEAGCVEGTNDEPRKTSKLWYLIPVGIFLAGLLFFLLKGVRRQQPDEEAYAHI